MKDPYTIILNPLQTEKSISLAVNRQYVFAVDRKANKIEIKHAIEHIYGVEVESVRTINCKGKPRRVRMTEGRRSDWKKAIVKLKEGQTIEFK